MSVALLLPTPRDTELAARLLADEAITAVRCDTVFDLERALEGEVGAVFVAEEWLSTGAQRVLGDTVVRQPGWSDLPILVLARVGSDSHHLARITSELGNATVLERPLRVATLTSAARSALRARWRQYQIHAQLEALEHARAQLDVAARRKDEFLAILGHELRNPLAPIRNALQVLLQRAKPRSDEHALMSMMRRQVDHMVRLVEDLIDVARVTRGTVELRCRPARVSEVLRSAVELSQPLIDAGQHALHVDVQDDALLVMADPVRIAQVFSNLLNNAAKYSPPGGRIDVTVAREGQQAVVTIVDAGVGIEPAVLPRVFDLFTQGNQGPHRAKDGLGIGLTLVRTLVELHGGTVSAHSEGPRRGSTFCVRLPLLEGDALPATPELVEPAAEVATPNALRVMVVDDNVDAAETLGMLLSSMGVDHRIAFEASMHCASPATSIRTRCSSTSACPGWTVTNSRDACAMHPAARRACSLH
ncbi:MULTISPECIES: hybrid sensor histidine kinase/response regulator [Lysobacteraceae]|nr:MULTISPECIES: hybrid sensor histidine kinase/response regulator [Lysobacter]